MKPARNARYESGRVYDSQARADQVVRTKPRKDKKGSYTEVIVEFPVEPGSSKKAADYASEMQRETRGYKSGGIVKGCGQAEKGTRKARMY